MALDTFVAGRYSGTYNSDDVGITDQGYELEITSSMEVIEESDAFGQCFIDGIYRGGSGYLQFNCKAYKDGSVAPFWPWGALGVLATTNAPIGRLASAVGSAMVLSSTANTPAAAAPASLTMAAILAENSPAKLLFNSKLRQVPVRLRAIPSVSTGTMKLFTLT